MRIYKDLTKVFVLITFFVITVSAQNYDGSIYTLQPGTMIRVRMDNEINSKVSSAGDTFTVTVSKAVVIRETEILPVGTVIEGRIINVKPSALGGGEGSFEVKFETLRLANGEKRSIEALLSNNKEKPKSSNNLRNLLSIISGTAIGAVIGTAVGKQNGALIGAGIGAGAGTSAALLRRGKEARIKADEEIEIRLNKEVTLPVEDY